ncbi:MAG TPA: CopD family protein [Nitrososphaeraceae archaeon]|nr:CopD family protein [Nitrososphaeraceae archaeon]
MALADVLVFWVHLTCASIWVGGSLFLGIVLAPMLGTIAESPADRLTLMLRIGRRFNRIALPAFIILIITGIYNSRALLLQPDVLVDSEYGIILLIKIIFVIATLIIYVVHIRSIDLQTERRIMSGDSISYIQPVRSRIILLGRVIVGLSLIILFLAALLNNSGSLTL